MNDFNPNHTFDIEDFEEYIEEVIGKNTKKFEKDPRTIPKNWWSDKIQRLWNIKKSKEKLFHEKQDLFTAMEFRKSIGKLKLEIKRSKKNSWNNFINEINPNSNSKIIWDKINRIHKQNKYKFNLIDDKHNAQQFLNQNFPNNPKKEILPFDPKLVHRFENEFSVKEISNVILNSSKTTPGHDNISYRLWKNLKYEYEEKLTEHLNKVWKKFYYPSRWKKNEYYTD